MGYSSRMAPFAIARKGEELVRPEQNAPHSAVRLVARLERASLLRGRGALHCRFSRFLVFEGVGAHLSESSRSDRFRAVYVFGGCGADGGLAVPEAVDRELVGKLRIGRGDGIDDVSPSKRVRHVIKCAGELRVWPILRVPAQGLGEGADDVLVATQSLIAARACSL